MCKDKKKQWKHNNNNNSTQNKSEKNEKKAKESNKATPKHDNKIFGKNSPRRNKFDLQQNDVDKNCAN